MKRGPVWLLLGAGFGPPFPLQRCDNGDIGDKSLNVSTLSPLSQGAGGGRKRGATSERLNGVGKLSPCGWRIGSRSRRKSSWLKRCTSACWKAGCISKSCCARYCETRRLGSAISRRRKRPWGCQKGTGIWFGLTPERCCAAPRKATWRIVRDDGEARCAGLAVCAYRNCRSVFILQ